MAYDLQLCRSLDLTEGGSCGLNIAAYIPFATQFATSSP